MQKVIFVCLGNICRSPVAEGIMLHLNDKHNLNWTIDSAGTANYHVGEAPDRRTIANARRNGVDLSPLRARQFRTEDFKKFDRIFVMDKNNHSNVLKLANTLEEKNKVELLLNVLHPETDMEVPDPYYGGEEDFEHVFQLVWSACEKLAINGIR